MTIHIGVTKPDLYVQNREGRFWKRGVVHRVVEVDLIAQMGGGYVVSLVGTSCGLTIEWPGQLYEGRPKEVQICQRCDR